MKKKDLILAGGVLGTALIVWLCIQLFLPKDYQKIRITVDGELYGEYSLREDREIAIGETNICRIENGKVKMIKANCPDKLCIKQKEVDASGGTIICLPNKVVIEAVGGDGPSQDGLDGVA